MAYLSSIHPWEGYYTRGNIKAGEAAADMTGMKCILRIAKKDPSFDYDRFFKAYAREWMVKEKPDFAESFADDPHPMDYQRINVTLQQFDEFLDLYDIKEGDRFKKNIEWVQFMKKNIDYKKPFYINSFDSDEIIFNMLRGTHVSTGRYDGSLPVSLDSLKILELCTSSRKEYKKNKKEYPNVFYETGSDDRKKTFCDAVINVDFSGDGSYNDMDIVKADLKDLVNGRAISGPSVPDKYSEFLNKYRENQERWKESEDERTVRIKKEFDHKGFLLGEDSIALKTVNVTVTGTVIKVNAGVKNLMSLQSSAAIMLFICRENEDKKNEIQGIYEYDELEIEAKKKKTAKAAVDIKDIAAFDEESKKYTVKKGKYELFIGNCDKQVHVAAFNLDEDVERTVIYQTPGWIDRIDWPFAVIGSGVKKGNPSVKIDTGIQTTYKDCGRIFSGILKKGAGELINKELNDPNSPIHGNGPDKITGGYKLLSRALLYSCGFDFEGKDRKTRHYVAYKRSASKSKTGSCLFVWEELYEDLKNWTWMGRYFDESDITREYDLTSIKAYEALTLSNIEKTFSLNRKNILMINAVEGISISGNRRIICEKDGEFVINTPDICSRCDNETCRKGIEESGNKIWDGQALLDESIFKDVYPDEMHGMMLLRNRFFKACAFNTKITEYFKENGIKTVRDMFGRELNAEDIKLIFTPDSLKYLKFSGDLFNGSKRSAKDPDHKTDAFDHWLKNLKTCDFGVVKTDKPQRKNGKHKVGYQILNTLPLSGDDMEKLFEHEKKYIASLWDNDELFREIIPKESAKGRFIRRMCELIGQDFYQCDDYISYKRQIIGDIKKRMRRGAMELEGEMLTLCSMPFEMLKYSGMEPKEREKGIKPLLKKDEAYIAGLPDGKPVTLCRYPHLSAGSVCSLTNKKTGEYSKWFNLRNTPDNSGIVVISPYESNIMVKLGGADFDSDTALFIREKIVQKAAAQLREKDGPMAPLCDRFAPEDDGLPVAQAGEVIKGKAETYPLTPYNLARLDQAIAGTQGNIGTISNDIQLFNSYLWEGLFSTEPGKEPAKKQREYCQKIYECILKLSVLNEIEIDRSKHSVDINTGAIRSAVMTSEYDGEPILKGPGARTKKKQVIRGLESETKEINSYYNPAFLYEIKKDRGAGNVSLRKEKYWNCAPDHLSELAAVIRKPRALYAKKKLVFDYNGIIGDMEKKQTKKIEKSLKDTVKALEKLDRRRHKTGEEPDERMKIQSAFVDVIMKMKSIRPKNIAYIVRETLCMKDEPEEKCYDSFMYFNKYRIMGLLFMAEEKIEGRINGEKQEQVPETDQNPIREVLKKIGVADF